MSNIILLRTNLKDTIANEYSKKVKTNTDIINKIADVVEIDCGDGCKPCTDIYTSGITDPDNYWGMMFKVGGNKIIDGQLIKQGDKNGPCFPLCNCTVEGTFNNIVSVVSGKLSDIALNDSDTETVTNNILQKLQDDNPDTDYNKNQIESIVKNITKNLKSDTTIDIDKRVNSAQIIQIRGYGNITGITMNACLGVIMDTLVSDETNIQTLTDITNQAIIHIKGVIDESFQDGLMNAFKQNVKFFIIIGIGLLCMIGFLILSFFWSAAKGS
jgi:hypothetical protein